MQDKKYLLKTS